jgi:hypothetical protein
LNDSAFSNILGASDHAAQHKAVVASFKEDFDGKPEDILQHIAVFTHCCEETVVIEVLNFIEKENDPPSHIDMSDPSNCTALLTDP